VYDNTRIIIVSDHGQQLDCFDDLKAKDRYSIPIDLMCYHALLMVKDFGNSGEIRTDKTFMTNADTPTLAFKDLIENPVNPFTGNAVTDEAKHEKDHYVLATNWRVWRNNGYRFKPGQCWNLQGDNFFDMKAWKHLGIK